MRTKLLGLGLAVGLLLGAPAAAECDLCGEWSLGAHALYFTPITCPYTYASVESTVSSPGLSRSVGKGQQVSCGADWGFRVFGDYLDGCLFAGVSYQWFEVANVDAVASEDFIFIPGGSVLIGRVVGRASTEYQNVDVRLGRHWFGGCGFRPYMYGNARWVDLSYRRALRAVSAGDGSVQTIREKSQLRGGAIGIGFGGEADIGCNVGAFIEANALGVIGRRSLNDVEYRSQPVVGTAQVRQEFYPSDVCVIPEFDFRIGIDYTYACGCWTLVGELGYEVDYFCRGAVFPELTGSGIPTAEDFLTAVCEDIGFSGLFFGARVIF